MLLINKKSLIFYLLSVCVVFFFYPLFFLQNVILDSFLGDQTFINQIFYFSKKEALQVFLCDWCSAIPVSFIVYCIFIVTNVFLKYLGIYTFRSFTLVNSTFFYAMLLVLFGANWLSFIYLLSTLIYSFCFYMVDDVCKVLKFRNNAN